MVEPAKPTPPTPRAPKRVEHLWRWILPLMIVATLWAWQRADQGAGDATEIGYTQLYTCFAEDKVDKITMTGADVHGSLKAAEDVGGHKVQRFRTTLPAQADPGFLPLLREHKVAVDVHSEEQPFIVRVLLSIVPWVLIFAGWVWL